MTSPKFPPAADTLPDPERIFAGITTSEPVIVAVSGGSDSMALLLLAHIWAQKNDVLLQAVTIDHGLRPEAAAEAAFVASVCAGLGINHVTLAWEGIKPSFGIQEAARRSRYSLMDDFAHEIGADIILTGHTRDDQVETVLMRSLRQGRDGDGRGLSGMARRTWLYGGCTIVRPLLGETRQGLRDYLARMPQSWIEDPSNIDESYERVRLRKSLLNDPQKVERVERLAAASARLRKALSDAVASYLSRNCELLPGPVYRLPLPAGPRVASAKPSSSHQPSPGPVFEQAVQVLVAMAGGQAYLISRRRLATVIEMIRDMMTGEGTSARKSRLTIGGAVIECNRESVCFYRETRNLSSVLLEPGETAIWDGRMHVFNGTALPIFVEPADRSQIREFEENRGKKYDVPRRAALWSTPVVHVQTTNGGTAPCLPLVEGEKLPKGLEIRLASPAIEHFCPEQDEALCNWVQSMNRYTAASLQP